MKLNHNLHPDEAQDKANFVIVLPNAKITLCDNFILRQEDVPYNENPEYYDFQPWSSWCSAHFSSYCFFIKYRNTRLRCKQFLYDLGPLSTLDHCALYDHWVWKMKPLVLDSGNICWLGYDYSQSKTATFFSCGTNVELRLLEGDLDAKDFKELCNTFIATAKSSAILEKKFYELSYWSRYSDCLNNACTNKDDYRPPSSLWKLRWPTYNIMSIGEPIITNHKKIQDYLNRAMQLTNLTTTYSV